MTEKKKKKHLELYIQHYQQILLVGNQYLIPANTQRHYNVVSTSLRSHDIKARLLWRCVFAGIKQHNSSSWSELPRPHLVYGPFSHVKHIYISQGMTKPTIRPVWPAKTHQPIHPPSMTRVLVYPSLYSPKAVEGTCNQWSLRSDCADAKADLRLRWSQKSYCTFCHTLAHIFM